MIYYFYQKMAMCAWQVQGLTTVAAVRSAPDLCAWACAAAYSLLLTRCWQSTPLHTSSHQLPHLRGVDGVNPHNSTFSTRKFSLDASGSLPYVSDRPDEPNSNASSSLPKEASVERGQVPQQRRVLKEGLPNYGYHPKLRLPDPESATHHIPNLAPPPIASESADPNWKCVFAPVHRNTLTLG
jgi:hypothetical protein